MSSPSIAIVGAGLGGLVLARVATDLALAIAEYGDDVEAALTGTRRPCSPAPPPQLKNPLRASNCVSLRTLRRDWFTSSRVWECP